MKALNEFYEKIAIQVMKMIPEGWDEAKFYGEVNTSAKTIFFYYLPVGKKGADYKNYEFSSNLTHHGRYYEYNTPQGKRVIAEHINDGRMHTHAGKPNRQANQYNYDFKKERYDNIYGPNGDHHIYYK